AAPPTVQDAAWQAADWLIAGQYRDALESLRQATAARPQDFWAWFLQGVCHDRLAQDAEAIAAYNACAALWPDYPWSYYNRGLARLKQQQYAEARVDFDIALRLQPAEADIYLHRALAWQGLAKPAEAVADLTAALDRGASPVRGHLLRAKARAQAGDVAGAAADRERGLRAPPRDEPDWLARGLAQLPADPQSALRDFKQALKLNPRSLPALQNQAHVLAQDAAKTEEAIQVLTQAIELYPDYAPARSGRGILLARLGNREKAHQDAQIALLHDTRAPTLYQLAGIYALSSRDRPEDRLEAFRLLAAALRLGYGHDLIATDRDLDPIRDTPEFRRLINGAQVPSPPPKLKVN
ncbi:MAG: tetratricopeptide repeat protein, partial [Planctomycetia bacterium]|nr:tetratricopeptide repeat protein [Planctomycetia bacterium]